MPRKIVEIRAREILSAGSFPTIETTVVLDNGSTGTASVPFGTSAGAHEATTLVDGDSRRYHGLGMLKAIANIQERIAPELVGQNPDDQEAVDRLMIEMDGTPNKSKLGGNAMLSISLGCARAVCADRRVQLFEYLAELGDYATPAPRIPIPMMVAIEGGRHADQSTDFQEYMILPVGNVPGSEAIRQGIEVYQTLRGELKRNGYAVNVGYEGAYAPTNWKSNAEPLQLITQAIEDSGYVPHDDITIGLDPAASEFYDVDSGTYELSRDERSLDSLGMIAYLRDLIDRYPIVSIEDGLAEDDWDGWVNLARSLGDRCTIVGDDLTVTQVERIQRAVELQCINAVLIKPNQCGTLSETLAAIKATQAAGYKTVISHRGGGETNDTLIVDLAFATHADMLKVGASRGERVCKYNRFMEIAQALSL